MSWPVRRPLDERGEAAAQAVADREVFRARMDELLVELVVAARNLRAGTPAPIARRALELLVERAVES